MSGKMSRIPYFFKQRMFCSSYETPVRSQSNHMYTLVHLSLYSFQTKRKQTNKPKRASQTSKNSHPYPQMCPVAPVLSPLFDTWPKVHRLCSPVADKLRLLSNKCTFRADRSVRCSPVCVTMCGNAAI